MPEPNIYDPRFVAALFDEMSKTYGVINLISSFGFCERWRRQAVDGVRLHPAAHVIEMMSGSGECWRFFAARLRASGRVVALDLSSEMCRRARENRPRFASIAIEVRQADALASGLLEESADHVVACFGLKTFSAEQLVLLAREVWRLLKPGGTFSFVEIATPRARWLRKPYLFYLRYVIPLLGRIFLGNPDNYRMLAVYTERFGSGDHVKELFERQGFQVRAEDLFFGCARRLVGARVELD
jgi:ubiquinone/menaquinone biosynthesis methyltransferase